MIHHVFANRANIGDWLSARGIQTMLGVDVVEHLCDEPFIPATLERLRDLTCDDVVVVGGGGLLMDYFGPFWDGLLDARLRATLVVWGVGLVDIKREHSRLCDALLRRIIDRATLTVVRDELTREALSRFGHATVALCPSLTVVSPAPQPGFGILHVANYSTVGAAEYEAMCATARRFAGETGRPYWETNNRVEHEQESRMTALLDRYAAADIIVASALHGCIVGVAMNKKVVAVSGDRKVEAFMESAGLSDWVVTQEEVASLGSWLSGVEGQRPAPWLRRRAIDENGAVARETRGLLVRTSVR